MASASSLVIRLTADTSQVAKTMRIIAKHLSALADELDAERHPAAAAAGRDAAGGECQECSHQRTMHSPEGCHAWSPGSRVKLCPCQLTAGGDQ